MLGPKLRSARVDQYKALGDREQPLYLAASRILAVIERERPELAYCFAVPQLSEEGDWIDWYAPEPGIVASWGEIMASEQEEARARLVGVRHGIVKLHRALQDSDDDDARECRDMLKWVFHHPDASHRFLVNDRPVLTFWGFTHEEASPGADPLDFSATYYPDFSGPKGHRAVRRAVRPGDSVPWWRHWWPWLALVAAILVSFFGLPTMPNSTPDSGASSKYSAEKHSPDSISSDSLSLCKKQWGQCATRGWRGSD